MNLRSAEVLVTGCFNIVHAEHIQLLEFASKWGQVTVGINADPYLQEKYGNHAIPLVNRAYVLRSIKYVNEVVVFSEENPSKLIRKLQPKYFVRGPDYRGSVLPEQAALDEVRAQVLIRPGIHDLSAGDITQRLSASAFSSIDILDY